MTWARFDDNHTDWKVWEGVSYAARWHYQALVELCCRQERWDGRIPLGTARRASDVEDPDGCIAELTAATGLLEQTEDAVVLLRIEDHVPPPSVRKNAELSKIRMQRHRKHKAGDHSTCLPETCSEAAPRNGDAEVTRNTGTMVPSRPGPKGQGTGRTGQANASSVTRNPSRSGSGYGPKQPDGTTYPGTWRRSKQEWVRLLAFPPWTIPRPKDDPNAFDLLLALSDPALEGLVEERVLPTIDENELGGANWRDVKGDKRTVPGAKIRAAALRRLRDDEEVGAA